MSILTGLSSLSLGGGHNPSNPLDLVITSHKSALPIGPCGGDFPPDVMIKIDTYLIKMFGLKSATAIKQESHKKRDLIKTILLKELNRSFKFSEAAYQALDFRGKGYVEVEDIAGAKFVYRLPYTKEDLEGYLRNDTIFKKTPRLKQEIFTKFFFPHQVKEETGGTNLDSDSDEEGGGNQGSPRDTQGQISDQMTNAESTSVMSNSNRNRDISNKLKEMERTLFERLSNNWVSVRKAFLDLDQDYDGFITAEDFAKFVGGSSGNSKFDFNILKILIKMKNVKKASQINYTDFCRWFGQIIEPAEAFYFRHDSMKNPQYEKNQKKVVMQNELGQKKIREIISNQNLKEKIIDKLHNQFKSLQKAFIEMNKSRSGFIQFEEFQDMVLSWGFEAPVQMIREVFNWFDHDKDQRICFEDLRATAGQDLAPREALYFRQDLKPGKSVTCKYEKCWENNVFNSKSQYCHLHQKILRNIALDKFSQLASKASSEDIWDSFVNEIVRQDFTMKLSQLDSLIRHCLQLPPLSFKEKEAIHESFRLKASGDVGDQADNLDDRVISLHALVNARKQTRLRRLDQLITLEADDEQAAEEGKTRGLEQIGEDQVVHLAQAKKLNWVGIWKSIKKIDKDSNGYVTLEEIDEIFREWYPLELEGKTLNRYFRYKYGSVANRNLINYKQLKLDVQLQLKSSIPSDTASVATSLQMKRSSSFKLPQPLTKQSNPYQDAEDDEDISMIKITGAQPVFVEIQDTMSQLGKKGLDAMSVRSSITPLAGNQKQGTSKFVLPLPRMERNSSIQKLNTATLMGDVENHRIFAEYQGEDISTTPVMKRAYKEFVINSSGTKLAAQIRSSASQSSLSLSKISHKGPLDEVKGKLAYEWKNIYRGLIQSDPEQRGIVPTSTFSKILHQHKTFLSREELKKVEQNFSPSSLTTVRRPNAGDGTSVRSLSSSQLGNTEIDYVRLSQDLGLHKQSLDFIKTKSQKYIDQITKFKDNSSRVGAAPSIKTDLSSLIAGQILGGSATDRVLINKTTQQQSGLEYKVRAMRDFLHSVDKQHSGLVPSANFMKVMRVFGIPAPSSSMITSHTLSNGMVEYEEIVEDMAANYAQRLNK